METKTHYRKVFKSDHLGIADLEDFIEENKRLVFTIKEVKQYILTSDKSSGIVVAGKRISANIAHFVEPIKPLVLNATNSKIVKSFNGNSPFVEDWGNTVIELYIDKSVKMKGEIVGGVRIKPNQPTKTKEKLTPDHKNWDVIVLKIKEGASMAKVKEFYDITENDAETLILQTQ